MNFFKKNIKLIIGFIVGVILASGITVYATSYFAGDVKYTRNNIETTVEAALNDLYSIKTENSDAVVKTNFTITGDRTLHEYNIGFEPSMIIFFNTSDSINWGSREDSKLYWGDGTGEWGANNFGDGSFITTSTGFKCIYDQTITATLIAVK